MFAQVTSAVSNGPGNLKASCQQAPPTIDCGLLEKVCGFCTSVVGSPTPFQSFRCHLVCKQDNWARSVCFQLFAAWIWRHPHDNCGCYRSLHRAERTSGDCSGRREGPRPSLPPPSILNSFCCLILRQDLAIQSRLALYSWVSCPSLPRAGISSMHQHMQLGFPFFNHEDVSQFQTSFPCW